MYGVFEIRKTACLCLVKLLKTLHNEKKRLEILKYVTEHFFKSKSYFNRMVYLQFVAFSLDFFSQNFVKINIIPDIFKLANDRVPNIRRKLASLMMGIRRRIDRNDGENINRFNECVEILKKDIDLDVSEVFLMKKGKFWGVLFVFYLSLNFYLIL